MLKMAPIWGQEGWWNEENGESMNWVNMKALERLKESEILLVD